ncbi:MAG: single-stranded-DNA-specific exonuclease RecJ [Candidatus Magasanikbacteria bacterium RIFCSPHIGHO2_02_FULL_51_14]|uniref:Single-stranded-DNA-specific exonuclease RecJ n=1 Tax=Candidatus Magasanikbacteria bacterium RIFCSPHIGHO2_02_FULL_51_14 TaxID=1798683 RepID=A0A1F6MNZ8_9BACT|nr:MAG: single-stranded-DNA-specific exonuclease RecJ [Candidatus Magasanikbacteria bacterium RIFCSPHIGHO2_02_FULL_51_14]
MQKQWRLLPDPPQPFYDEHPELPPVVARLLFHRNITDAKKIDEFLNPDYTQDVHDPFLFRDMRKAVDRIFTAIDAEQKIIVHGDYDADGVCGAVILVSTIKTVGGASVGVFLPHRETDGYGLNKKNVQYLADEKTNLIITCDCGISNKEEIELANSLGMDVIVTDHHSIPHELPPAYAIIHPKIEGEPYPDKGLCGGAVAFKLAQALLSTHKQKGGALPNGQSHESFEKWLLGMVAIASVADMVPLLDESRTLTKYGLVVLNKTNQIGLQKLLLEARLMEEDGSKKREFDTHTIGFQIAPRLNAAGRMNHANVAFNLLMTADPTEAADLAHELNKNNQDRQDLVEKLCKEAEEQADAQKDAPVLIIIGRGWSTGIVGLIAGKIKEKQYRPTIVVAVNESGVTGSGRSIDEFNMIQALQELPPQLFQKLGGHPMACGFTLAGEQEIEPLKQALIEKYQEKTAGLDVSPKLLVDAEIALEDVSWVLYDILQKFEPFGKDNEKPTYFARGVTVQTVKSIGKNGNHITIMGSHRTNKLRKMIGWGFCSDSEEKMNWCKILHQGDRIDVVFEIGVNEWNGNREIQLRIVDLKKRIEHGLNELDE